ncbi:MAG: FAD-binding protein [Oribacterium sp.]|nr:FAD-binding protein [Oribacterium sp.]
MVNINEERIENVVIGSGAAGLQAALRISQNGDEVAIVTENLKSGTSRNTGSDKQTYYKLSLAGDNSDSVLKMAQDLFSGGAVDGDMALCEAALSARSFYRLVELGVPFPDNEFGEFMGYRTDHDETGRATSAGPYTSKIMTECLEKEVKSRNIRILDNHQAIKLLVQDKKIYGVLCLETGNRTEPVYRLIWCDNVILATGGPAGMYHDSVYPSSQLGSSGMAFRAGVKGKNLTEWQFGMASLNPRWNVSGTYMQALPAFISTDMDGNDEREFLTEFFDNKEEMLSNIFLKGYQWPFDVNKINGGSSVIDLMVFQETILRKRRVFLDFRRNAGGEPVVFEKLSNEAFQYLKNAEALLETPYERLKKMNEPAVSYYLDHDIDLEKDMLEIAVCAQHNNGGLSTDAWWETDIQGLFAVGEVNGSHGVTRPGGTALNAGQVGALRAAEKIHLRKQETERNAKVDLVSGVVKPLKTNTEDRLRKEAEEYANMPSWNHGSKELNEVWESATRRMSETGGMIRNARKLSAAVKEVGKELENFSDLIKKPTIMQLSLYYRLYDMLTTQFVYLSAMEKYALSEAGSRGSALYTDDLGLKWESWMPELYRCCLDLKIHDSYIQELALEKDNNGKDIAVETIRNIRPIPEMDYFFEKQWLSYRERHNLYERKT